MKRRVPSEPLRFVVVGRANTNWLHSPHAGLSPGLLLRLNHEEAAEAVGDEVTGINALTRRA